MKNFRIAVAAAVLVTLTISVPAAAQPSRLYDKEVKALLDQAKNSYEHFWDALDGQTRNSTFKNATGEFVAKTLNEDYKKALDTAKDRLSDSYAASNEVGGCSSRRSGSTRSSASRGPSMKGASEWQAHATQLGQIANAYGATFPPAANQVFSRHNDKDVIHAASSVEQASKRLADALDNSLKKDKNTPEAARKAIVEDVKRLGELAKTLESTVDDKKPASAQVTALRDQAAKVKTAIAGSSAAAAVLGQWSAIENTLGTIGAAFHMK